MFRSSAVSSALACTSWTTQSFPIIKIDHINVHRHVKCLVPNFHFLYKVSNIEVRKKLLTGNVLFHKDGSTNQHDKVTIAFRIVSQTIVLTQGYNQLILP